MAKVKPCHKHQSNELNIHLDSAMTLSHSDGINDTGISDILTLNLIPSFFSSYRISAIIDLHLLFFLLIVPKLTSRFLTFLLWGVQWTIPVMPYIYRVQNRAQGLLCQAPVLPCLWAASVEKGAPCPLYKGVFLWPSHVCGNGFLPEGLSCPNLYRDAL